MSQLNSHGPGGGPGNQPQNIHAMNFNRPNGMINSVVSQSIGNLATVITFPAPPQNVTSVSHSVTSLYRTASTINNGWSPPPKVRALAETSLSTQKQLNARKEQREQEKVQPAPNDPITLANVNPRQSSSVNANASNNQTQNRVVITSLQSLKQQQQVMLGNIAGKTHKQANTSAQNGEAPIAVKQTINLGPTEYSATAAVNSYLNHQITNADNSRSRQNINMRQVSLPKNQQSKTALNPQSSPPQKEVGQAMAPLDSKRRRQSASRNRRNIDSQNTYYYQAQNPQFMLTTSPSKLHLKESNTGRAIPPTCRTPHRAARINQHSTSTDQVTGEVVNLFSDPSVKQIVVPPNGTGLQNIPDSPSNQKGRFFTINSEVMAEAMASKANVRHRPPTSAEANRFSQRIHTVHVVAKESTLSKQISEITKTNAQPFQVLSSQKQLVHRVTPTQDDAQTKRMTRGTINLSQAVEAMNVQQNQGSFNRQSSIGKMNSSNLLLRSNATQDMNTAQYSGSGAPAKVSSGSRIHAEGNGNITLNNRNSKDRQPHPQSSGVISIPSISMSDPSRITSSRDKVSGPSKATVDNNFTLHKQYMQNMGIAKIGQSYQGHSQTLSGLGQINHGHSFNGLEENIMVTYASANHSASPQKRIQRDHKDFINVSGGGFYHHATTGATTTLISENLTGSKETLPLSSEMFSGRRSVDGNTSGFASGTNFQPKTKPLLSNTLQESVLYPSQKQTSEGFDLAKKTSNLPKDITNQVNLVPNNSAVHKQTQIQRQLHLQQQVIQKAQGNSKNKRIVLAAGSSHFRHSSNTVKKQLLAQASNGVIQSANTKTDQSGLAMLNNVIAAAAATSSSLERDKPKESAKQRPSDQFQQFKIMRQAAQGNSYDSSTLTTAASTAKPISQSETQGSPVKLVKNNPALTQTGTVAGKKLGAKPLVPPQSQGYYAKAQKGIDEFNKELQSIIEKEKQLTDEIIKNSLVKPNGRFNFEALAHLNEIMESKKKIKKRFGIEGLAVNKDLSKTASGVYGMNAADEESEDAIEILEKLQGPNQPENISLDFPLPPLFPGVLGSEGRKRISDEFLKNHYGLQKNGVEDGKATTVEEQYLRLVQSLQNSAEKSNRSQVQPTGPNADSPPNKKLKKKKEQVPQQQNQDQPKPKSSLPAKQKIQIYHQEDASLKHIQEHPINKAIQKINYMIRLIFKSQINPRNDAVCAPGGQIPPGTGTDGPKIIKLAGDSNGFQNSGTATQTSLQQHLIEEQRMQEIQRVAGKWFNLQIPLKRLEVSKAALREYFQSREFLHTLRNKINQMLFGAINKSNKMIEMVVQLQQQQQLLGLQFQRFYVGWGNNDPIVRQVLKVRPWWQQCNNEDFSEVSFLWTAWKKQQHIDYLYGDAAKSTSRTKKGGTAQQSHENTVIGNFDPDTSVLEDKPITTLKNSADRGIKVYNRMEQNKQLTNKKGVFLNMREYYYLIGEDPFDVLPLTFLIKPKSSQGDADFQRFTLYFQEMAQQSKRNDRARQVESDHRIRQIKFDLQKRRKEERKKQGDANQKRKETLGKPSTSLPPWKMAKKRGQLQSQENGAHGGDDSDNDSPWKTGDDGTDDERDSEKRQEEEKKAIENDPIMKEICERYPKYRNIWIVKPGENTNRGQGIEVCSDLNEIKSIVMNGPGTVQNAGGHTLDQTFIIQRYIDNPLLIHGRKFDFRCYGLMTSINGHLKGYFYEDAYIRTSCKEFDIEDVHNKFIHLTNDAVQKYSNDYGKYENGNKLSLNDFQKYLRQSHPHMNIDVFKHIVPQIRKLVTDSYRAVYGKIDPSRLHNTFEMFGYDFMLDEDFRLYLIEVNTNPCLEMTCPLLARIIPEVLDNTFRMVLDPIFPQPESYISRKTQQVPTEVKYTLVFDEDLDGPELLKLRTDQNRAGFASENDNKGAIGIIDEIESDEEDDLREAECAPSKMPPIQK